MLELAVGEGTRCVLRLWALPCGDDWSLTICGGTLHHVGAAVLAVPTPPDPHTGRRSATVSVLCALEHKDDELARRIAKRVSATLGCNVAAVAGVHIDGATQAELQQFLEHGDTLCQTLLDRLTPSKG